MKIQSSCFEKERNGMQETNLVVYEKKENSTNEKDANANGIKLAERDTKLCRQQNLYLMRTFVFNPKFCVFLLSPSNHFDLTFD